MTLITVVVILLWVIPLAIKAKVKWPTILRMILGFLLGAIPVVIGAVVMNSWAESRWLPALGLSGFKLGVGQSLVAGFGEEFLKLIAALLSCIKMKNARKIDYILVFGAVGAGFETLESLAAVSSILTLAVRVLLALHVVWLFHEGAKYFNTVNGKKLSLLFGYITVAVLHSLFDMGGLSLQADILTEDEMVFGVLLLAIGLIANIVFIIKTMKMAIKETKA